MQKRVLLIIWCVLFVVYLVLIPLCYLIISSNDEGIPIYNNLEERATWYNYNALQFQNDIYVSYIAEVCKSTPNPITCVYDYIPYIWDDKRDYDFSLIRSPTEYMSKGGVCRDITLFRAAVLIKMKYTPSYIFEPNHVHVAVFDKDNTYDMNNQYLFLNDVVVSDKTNN